jgi:hypothetical protein
MKLVNQMICASSSSDVDEHADDKWQRGLSIRIEINFVLFYSISQVINRSFSLSFVLVNSIQSELIMDWIPVPCPCRAARVSPVVHRIPIYPHRHSAINRCPHRRICPSTTMNIHRSSSKSIEVINRTNISLCTRSVRR